jgi:hypothetical protein
MSKEIADHPGKAVLQYILFPVDFTDRWQHGGVGIFATPRLV